MFSFLLPVDQKITISRAGVPNQAVSQLWENNVELYSDVFCITIMLLLSYIMAPCIFDYRSITKLVAKFHKASSTSIKIYWRKKPVCVLV